jgi:hypothetical protein
LFDLAQFRGSPLGIRVSPANVGMVFTRAIRVVGDRLIIQLPTTTPSGIAVTRTLVFARAGVD